MEQKPSTLAAVGQEIKGIPPVSYTHLDVYKRQVYILTKGGPGTATITPSVVLYEQGFTYRKMGYASAIGVIMFAIIMVLTVINQKLMKNTESMD